MRGGPLSIQRKKKNHEGRGNGNLGLKEKPTGQRQKENAGEPTVKKGRNIGKGEVSQGHGRQISSGVAGKKEKGGQQDV